MSKFRKDQVASALSGLSGLSGIVGSNGPTPFVGALDGLSNLAHVYWPPAVLVGDHDGSSTATLRRDSDDDETTTSRGDADGTIDTATLTTWAGGADIFVVTAVDQVGSDDTTQATTVSQPLLNLGDANFNSKPSMTFANDYLRGVFTVGGNISQPYTAIAIARLDDVGSPPTNDVCDGVANKAEIKEDGTGEWAVNTGTNAISATSSDGNPNIFMLTANSPSTILRVNGVITLAASDTGNQAMDGLTLGARINNSGEWSGEIIGAIIVDGESSDADKNQVGNNVFEDIYGGSYTDIT